MHIPLPRLRPNHEPHALIRRVEDPLVELPGHPDPLERIPPATGPRAAVSVLVPHAHDPLAALVPAALPAHRPHGVGMGGVGTGVVGVGRAVGGVVPGGDFRRRGGDAGGAGGRFGGRDEGGGGAEDVVEVGVDGRFDVDGVRGRAGVDEGHEDAQADAEHGRAGPAELGGRLARLVKGPLALLSEGDDFGQEDDVLAVQLHARGIDLETVVVAAQAGVEGFHGVHLPFLGTLGFQGVLGAAEGRALVEGLEALLVEVCEGVVEFARCLLVLEDGVDGEAEGDDFDCHEAGNEPSGAICQYRRAFKEMDGALTTLQGASICSFSRICRCI